MLNCHYSQNFKLLGSGLMLDPDAIEEEDEWFWWMGREIEEGWRNRWRG